MPRVNNGASESEDVSPRKYYLREGLKRDILIE